jgi:hypothetical protein
VPEHIGNTGISAVAWAGRIMRSLNVQTKRGEELGKFTERRHFLSDTRQNLDAANTEGQELLAHELNHIIQQTQPRWLPQRRLPNLDLSPAPVALTGIHPGAGMILPAPAENTHPIDHARGGVVQAKAEVQRSAAEGSTEKGSKSPTRRNVGEIADRVYRLMQHDLILERERVAKTY